MMNKQIFESTLLGEKYTKYTHPSGFDIYVFPKDFTTIYAIFGVKYGSINSSFKIKNGSHTSDVVTVPDGIAHFLEHKLFANENGSDSFERFAELGADANAYTAFNKTAYLFSATDNFYDSLRELITFVTHPYFTEENIASEIGIITEEIKMYDDSTSDRCFYGMLEGMYEHHSIRRNITGTAESIKKISPQMLYRCYDEFYNLSNMALFICGKVDDDKILEIANELLPKKPTPFNVIYENENEKESPAAYKNYVESKMQIVKPIFDIGIKDTAIPHDLNERSKRDAAFDILNEMIFSQSGDLYTLLFEQNMISPGFSYAYTITDSYAYASLSGESNDPTAVLDEILKYIDKLKRDGLSYEDFICAKRILYSDFIRSFDSTENIANDLMSFVFDDLEIFSYAEVIDSITLDDVKSLLEHAFDSEKITLSVVKPLDDSANKN